ncbi:glycoside hydrolase family 38 N-terminal domain-containing protein [Rossellomorea sp. H39__3]
MQRQEEKLDGKKTAHIISHSHWDREWYMSLEEHKYYLVKLFDDLLAKLKEDPDFHSFHLDGQTIMVDDYLGVRPEREAEVKAYIREGRLIVGPWYILQDAFLTSSEANVRNLLYGMKDTAEWGRTGISATTLIRSASTVRHPSSLSRPILIQPPSEGA